MFNPYDHIPKENPVLRHAGQTVAPHSNYPKKDIGNFHATLHEIETHRIDIAPSYEDWLTLGFALASEYGENGRDYFHRLSQFYSKYKSGETDKQYTRCLRGKQGITIATFFYLAKNAGIKIKT